VLFKGDTLNYNRGQKFSTRDQDNDANTGVACAVKHKSAWWYGSCHASNLNGLYMRGNHTQRDYGVEWHDWTDHYYSLRFTEMKIRPFHV